MILWCKEQVNQRKILHVSRRLIHSKWLRNRFTICLECSYWRTSFWRLWMQVHGHYLWHWLEQEVQHDCMFRVRTLVSNHGLCLRQKLKRNWFFTRKKLHWWGRVTWTGRTKMKRNGCELKNWLQSIWNIQKDKVWIHWVSKCWLWENNVLNEW